MTQNRNISKVQKEEILPAPDGTVTAEDRAHVSNQVHVENVVKSDFEQCLENDLDCFINNKEFAISFTYHSPKNNNLDVTLNGIFTDEFGTDSPGTTMEVQSVAPTLMVKTSALPGGRVRPEDWVTIRGKQFRIKDDQPDGTGITTLILKSR